MNSFEVYRMPRSDISTFNKEDRTLFYRFITPDADYKDAKNTFYYGTDANSKEAYRKHFFLTLEDIIQYKKLITPEENDVIIDVYQFPESTIINNLGMGVYFGDRNYFTPFEISITSTEIFSFFHNELSFPEQMNKLQRKLITKEDLKTIYKGKIEISNIHDYDFSDEYYDFYTIAEDIFEKNNKEIELCSKFFSESGNQQKVFQKIKNELKR